MNSAFAGGPLRIGASLSLTGRYAMFGTQAAHGLRSWATLDGNAEIVIIDDRSEPSRVAPALSSLTDGCDLLLGPYSTQLMRAANKVVADLGKLLWNHGGSGDDVEAAAPGHVVSVLAPTSRYAEPFVQMLAGRASVAPLFLRSGRGRFGAQVIEGAERTAVRLGIPTQRLAPDEPLPAHHDGDWDFFCAATFPDDVATVREALHQRRPPRTLGAVAAGVHEFGAAVLRPDGIYGIAQWLPGRGGTIHVGPSEDDFLAEYAKASGGVPDYPAVQAAATAALAAHCARTAGDLSRPALWAAATGLRTATLLGRFAIDSTTGAQREHQTVLTRWTADGLSPVSGTTRLD
ncbi:ABC transporter substrate-binding protein [Pseudonocardia acaciae]|uniref:ABC transporter substrate-binding protein n=1 Tax=Pseudonocardia acaciae TaxID=551276 RepID=UPI00048FEF47|nr:ABC transporter substrate-binding protein [Pseudonocardia acaciae]